MDLKLTFTTDKEGLHLIDAISGVGLHWKTEADVAVYCEQSDGEPWEQAFRSALREIVQQHAKTGAKLGTEDVHKKDFTFEPAKAVATWP